MKTINDVAPREVAGRDMILRVNMQHQAAAYAALEILEGGEVDRVYCDYHDDFVVRRSAGGQVTYHFFQVKTKGRLNQLWTLSEIFSLKSRAQKEGDDDLKAVGNSFAGRLLSLSVSFGTACSRVTLLSNTQFLEEVEKLVHDFQSDTTDTKGAKLVRKHFNKIFNVTVTEELANGYLQKLSLQPGVSYIGQEDEFAVAAREALHKYSEIDLQRHEAADLAAGLVSLINRKTIAKIADLPPERLDAAVSVGLTDLLGVLSISHEAYQALRGGEEPRALKSASIIQRTMEAAGANDGMVEYASHQKVAWDIWLRDARHVYHELDLNFLLQSTDDLRDEWMRAGGVMRDLQPIIESARTKGAAAKFPSLTKELLFGGVIAAFVRRGTR